MYQTVIEFVVTSFAPPFADDPAHVIGISPVSVAVVKIVSGRDGPVLPPWKRCPAAVCMLLAVFMIVAVAKKSAAAPVTVAEIIEVSPKVTV